MNDFITLSGQAHGDVARRLLQCNGDVGALRPFIGDDGRSFVTVTDRNTGKPQTLLTNAPASMTREAWVYLDRTIIRVFKQRLRAWADLMERGLRWDIPEAMAKPVIQYQTMTDISPATISMDGLRESERDRPQYDIANLPLPIIHKDFSFSLREVLISRQGPLTVGGGLAPLDTTTAELAARRVAEEVEKLLLGVSSSYTYGGGTIYGYTNYPNRLTKVMTAPTGLNPYVTFSEVLAMRQQSYDAFRFGPWVLYTSLSWDQYLDADYTVSGGTVLAGTSLRQRLRQINGIVDIVPLDYLPAKTMLLVQLTPETVRGIVGMDVTTVDWESHGGMQLNFKIMTIQVPALRADANNRTGIVHGTHP